MHQNAGNAQGGCNLAGMLSSGAAKTDQDIVGRIVTLGNGDPANGVGHVVIGNLQQAFGQILKG